MGEVGGWVAVGFEAVRDAFAEDPRGGSALTVLRDGTPVVELWEGWRDAARTRPWEPDTRVNVYSVGKPVIALAVVLLAERRLLDLDDPIARHWATFRGGASVRQALAHAAGLPVFPVPRPASAWAEWDVLCGDLAAAEPLWPPGTVAAEHALTYGHLLGEIVRRVDGRPPALFVAEEIAQPYGLDFGFGGERHPTEPRSANSDDAEGDSHHAERTSGGRRAEPNSRDSRRADSRDSRRAEMNSGESHYAELEFDAPDWPARNLGEPGSLHALAVSNPAGARDLTVVNSPLWRNACIPAVNLHATATSIARFYAAPPSKQLAVAQFTGVDRFLGEEVVWGLGVQIEPDGSWGMGGLGGNCGWADPAAGLTVGYVTRRLGDFAAADRIDAALKA